MDLPWTSHPTAPQLPLGAARPSPGLCPPVDAGQRGGAALPGHSQGDAEAQRCRRRCLVILGAAGGLQFFCKLEAGTGSYNKFIVVSPYKDPPPPHVRLRQLRVFAGALTWSTTCLVHSLGSPQSPKKSEQSERRCSFVMKSIPLLQVLPDVGELGVCQIFGDPRFHQSALRSSNFLFVFGFMTRRVKASQHVDQPTYRTWKTGKTLRVPRNRPTDPPPDPRHLPPVAGDAVRMLARHTELRHGSRMVLYELRHCPKAHWTLTPTYPTNPRVPCLL